MDFIQERLFYFCRSNNISECIIYLKQKLRKDNQIDMYDSIYNSFVNSLDGLNDERYNSFEIIDGLDIPIYMMIFCQVYRHLLFPLKFPHETRLNDDLLKWLVNLFDKRYSTLSLILVSKQLINLYHEVKFTKEEIEYVFNQASIDKIYPQNAILDTLMVGSPNIYMNYDNKTLPKNRFCFFYIMMGNSSNLSFDSLNKLLFDDDRITKIPIGFKFYTDKKGPHGGNYKPFNFFEHDEIHSTTITMNISHVNFQAIRDKLKSLVPNTLIYRIFVIFFHSSIFEELRQEIIKYDDEFLNKFCLYVSVFTYSNVNILDDFEEKFVRIPENIDTADMRFVFEYLVNSYDVSEKTDSELIIRYTNFKNRFSEVEDEFNKINAMSNNPTIENYDEYRDTIVANIAEINMELFRYFCNQYLKLTVPDDLVFFS